VTFSRTRHTTPQPHCAVDATAAVLFLVPPMPDLRCPSAQKHLLGERFDRRFEVSGDQRRVDRQPRLDRQRQETGSRLDHLIPVGHEKICKTYVRIDRDMGVVIEILAIGVAVVWLQITVTRPYLLIAAFLQGCAHDPHRPHRRPRPAASRHVSAAIAASGFLSSPTTTRSLRTGWPNPAGASASPAGLIA
jgi:hypothetical protein